MVDDGAVAASNEPGSDEICGGKVGRVTSGPQLGAAGRPRGEVSLAELQEHFASLQQEFEHFKEGRCRPPSQIGKAPFANLQPAPLGQRLGALPVTSAGGVEPPRAQLVPAAPETHHSASPAQDSRRDGRAREPPRSRRTPSPLPPQHPPTGGPPRGQRAPSPHAPPGAGVQRAKAPPSEVRQSLPPQLPISAGRVRDVDTANQPANVAPQQQQQKQNQQPQKRKKKKNERPAWRDDFVERSSPWDKELAQEAAAARNEGRQEPRVQEPVAAEPRAPEPSRGGAGKGPNRKWGSDGGSSSASTRDTAAAGDSHGASGGSPEGGQKSGPGDQPAKRRGPSSAINRARAAVVAAAMEAAQQHAQEQQVAARGGMMLVIPGGPPSPDLDPPLQAEQHASEQDNARRSPSRVSLIPSPRSDTQPQETRHRSQSSRIPLTPRSRECEHSSEPLPAQDRWYPAPHAAALRHSSPRQAPQPPAASPAVCATSRGADESLTVDTAPGRSANPQRRRRQWEVPGSTGGATSGSSGGGGDSAAGELVGGGLLDGPAASARRLLGSRHVSENGDAPVEATVAGFLPEVPPAEAVRPSAGALAPLLRVPAASCSGSGSGGGNSSGGGGPVPPLQPMPPACRPPSRPNSRPGSRPASRTPSNNGAAQQPDSLTQLGSPPVKRTSSHPGCVGGGSSGGGSGAACGDLAADSVLTDGVGEPLTVPTPHELPNSRRGSWGQAPAPPSAMSGVAPLPISSTGASVAALQASSAGGGETPRSATGPLTHRDRAEYLRKLSALKRPAPHESVRRLTEDGALAAGVAASAGSSAGGSSSSAGGSSSSAGGSACAGYSRKWMEPGSGDTPLSAAPVEAVGSAPAAVRAARNRGHSADVYSSIGGAPGGGASGGGDNAAAPARPPGPQRGRSQQELTKPPLDQTPADKIGLHHPEHPAERPPSPQAPQPTSRMRPLAPLQVPSGPDNPSPGHSSHSASPFAEQGQRQGGPPAGAVPPLQVGVSASGGAISAEQYMAFAVQNPEVAVAAAQAALNANPGRARARWNLPPEQPQGVGSTAAAPAPPPWVQQQPPQPHTWQQPGQPQQPPQHQQQPQQQPLAAAIVSATAALNPGQMPLPHRAHQYPHSAPPQHDDLRRVASEGPRTHVGGRPPGYHVPPDMQPPLGIGAPPGSAPGFGGHMGANPRPPPPLPPPPMVQGLFPGAPGGGNVSSGGGGYVGMAPPWPGPGDGSLDGGSGRLAALANGGQYPSALQPIRPAMVAPGEPWAPGPPPPPGPPLLQPPFQGPPQGHPPPNWNGNAYLPGARNTGYYGPSAGGGMGLPGGGEGYGPSGPVMAAGGPMDMYKPTQPFRRISNGPNDGYGSPGPSFAPPPVGGPGFPGPGGPPGPPAGAGPMPSPGGDLPDYMRVSMSRMVAGWSAPNAKHGALSGFNDVWHQRNSRMSPPPGHYNGGLQGQPSGPPGMPPQGSGGMGGYGGGGLPPAQGAMSNGVGRMGPAGMGGSGGGADGSGASGSGGRVRETGFEGLSLAEVLASKPKKEPLPFKKKTESSGGGSSGGKREGG